MTWQKLIAYVLGGIALIVMGWLLHSAFIPKPTIEVKERIVYDTVRTTKTITIRNTKTDTIRITEKGFTYTDSLVGSKNEVSYNIQHSITKDKEILSDWKVTLEPQLKTVTQYVTKDSIRTVIQDKYLPLPFFLNTFAYISIIELAIIVLAIIF